MPAGLDGNPEPIVTPTRTGVIDAVAEAVAAAKQPSLPLLVAIDGIDGSGKSTFADELAASLVADGHQVVRASVDSFHNPRQVRYRRGATSPVGFFLDSHDLDALRRVLLEPMRSGQGAYATAVFDEPTDQAVAIEPVGITGEEVLLFDGIFAMRDELARYWDFTIFLDGQQRVDQRRLALILEDLPNNPIDVVSHVLTWQQRIDRYASGMRYYLDLVDPVEDVDVYIDNNDLAAPCITDPPDG